MLLFFPEVLQKEATHFITQISPYYTATTKFCTDITLDHNVLRVLVCVFVFFAFAWKRSDISREKNP